MAVRTSAPFTISPQAVSWTRRSVAGFLARHPGSVSPYDICGEQISAGTGLSPSTSVPHPHHIIIIQQLSSYFHLQSFAKQGKRDKPGTLPEIIIVGNWPASRGENVFPTLLDAF